MINSEIKDNMAHGQGINTSEFGEKFEGNFEYDEWNGFGKWTRVDG